MGKLAPDGTAAPHELSTERSWTWAEELPSSRQCLFAMGWLGGGDERLWRFDPSQDIAGGDAFQPIGYIGATFLSVACNKDRVFFIQYKNLHDARTHWTEVIREKEPQAIDFEDELHLRSIAICPSADNRVVDHGRIVDRQGRQPTMIEALAADDHGNVFMLGSWNALSADEASHQYVWPGLKDFYADKCDTYKDIEPHTYKVMHRGQFFSHANVSADISSAQGP
jgi:hypothetical protein